MENLFGNKVCPTNCNADCSECAMVLNRLDVLKLLIDRDADIYSIKQAIEAEKREGNPKLFPAVGFYNRAMLDVDKCFTDEEFELIKRVFA